VQTPKPSPASFAKETYFGITALRFINHAGVARYGRHRISPESGVEHPSEAAAQGKDANYLFEELTHRLATGLIRFQIAVQIANERDIVDDATVHWPEERPLIPLGTVALNARAADNELQQRHIIFDSSARRHPDFTDTTLPRRPSICATRCRAFHENTRRGRTRAVC
jgi:catalase